MAPSPTQLVWRRRIEAGLRLAEPALDLVLFAGDRISRAVDRDALDAPPPARPVLPENDCARRLLSGLMRARPGDSGDIRQYAPDDPLLLASFAAALLPLAPAQREQVLTCPTLLDRLNTLMGFLPGEVWELN